MKVKEKGSGIPSGASRRSQAERSQATRDALIGAARKLFAKRGYAEVGTEEIVRAAGLTRGALYHHFGGKRELLAAVYEQIERELAERIACRGAWRNRSLGGDAGRNRDVPRRLPRARGAADRVARRPRRPRLGTLARDRGRGTALG